MGGLAGASQKLEMKALSRPAWVGVMLLLSFSMIDCSGRTFAGRQLLQAFTPAPSTTSAIQAAEAAAASVRAGNISAALDAVTAAAATAGSPAEAPSPAALAPRPALTLSVPVTITVPSATVSDDPEVPQVDFRCFMMQSLETFNATLQAEFVKALQLSTLANVAAHIDNISAGSIIVAASVIFLDGNATAASQMQSRLSSDNPEVVQGIFPESTFGPVIMSAVNQTNVTNPNVQAASATAISNQVKVGLIVGLAVAGLMVLLLIAAVVGLTVARHPRNKRRRRSNRRRPESAYHSTSQPPTPRQAEDLVRQQLYD